MKDCLTCCCCCWWCTLTKKTPLATFPLLCIFSLNSYLFSYLIVFSHLIAALLVLRVQSSTFIQPRNKFLIWMRLLPQLYNFRLAFWTLFMFWSALSRYVEEEEKIQSHHVISKVSKKYLMWVWMAGEPTDFSTPASVFVDGWKYLWHNTSACDFIIWFCGFLNRSYTRTENEQGVPAFPLFCLPLPFLPTCKHLGDVLSWNWFTWSMIIWGKTLPKSCGLAFFTGMPFL